MSYKENKICVVCKNQDLIQYIDLGVQPLANSYHKNDIILSKYPLQVNVCNSCWHSQLSVSVDPSEMFDDYFYVSDTSKTLDSYFDWTTNYILEKNTNCSNVLEIACNSGLLLEKFKNKGLNCVGVDPAKNLRQLSVDRNLDVYVDYWNSDLSEKVKQENGLFDLVLAFHVLPHVPDPIEFINSCKNVLNENGSIYLQTSQCDMFLNNEFDVIYHEHTSYFTAKSIQRLARETGLFVSDIIKTDIHGKSFLFCLQKQVSYEIKLKELIAEEEKYNIHNLVKYNEFALQANNTKTLLTSKLNEFRNKGYTIVGYGAAAKGNTLLNYIQFKLDFIIDDNPLKHGYKTPGMDIDIYSIDKLTESFDKICFVPLAWNFFTEIKQKIKSKRCSNKDVFIRYFPNYTEESVNVIKLETNNKVAVHSDDHKHPEGIYYDNNMNPQFVKEVENYFNNKQLDFLDLGCAGGELVSHMFDRNHNSVGLEGSDHCLNVRPEMVKEVGFEPLGHKNWKKHGNKVLFTCDITKEYQLYKDNLPTQFDIITCFDVMEHFNPDEVETFLKQTHKHIKDDGLFVVQIHLGPSGRHTSSLNTPENLNYHKSVFSKQKWIEMIARYFNQIDYPFTCHNRSHIYGFDPFGYLIYAGKKIK